jgi:Cys-Gly metallodipeptidase DUG1
LLGWLNVLQAHKELELKLPVNLKLCFEGMEESGSEKLDELIRQDEFFKGANAVCIVRLHVYSPICINQNLLTYLQSDNTWLNNRTPCLTYGLRGIIYFKVTISGPIRDLHSGEFGGVVHEPMTDLIQLMSKLVTPKGKILVPGVNELVAPLTDAERYAL